jgi:peptidoglycan/LPS O-acetylase OafA/YrhL
VDGGAGRGVARLDSLTGMRFVAALGVFGLHTTGSAPEALRALAAPGNTGVCFFFVLSGFVLAWTARDGDRAPAFYRRRVARVVPNHVVTWAVVLVALLATGAGVGAEALAALLLVQAWVPDQDVVLAVNGPSWTLACEAFFYLCFPVLLPLLARVRRRASLAVALGVAPAVWTTLWTVLLDDPVGEVGLYVVANLPPVRLLEFALGIVVALLVRDGRWDLPLRWAALLAAAAYAVTVVAPEQYGTSATTALPYAVLVAALAHADVARRRTALSGRWAVRLGTWSFAFYLVHVPVLDALKAVAGEATWWQRGVVALPLALLAAALLFRLVERPAESRLRAGAAPARLGGPFPGAS